MAFTFRRSIKFGHEQLTKVQVAGTIPDREFIHEVESFEPRDRKRRSHILKKTPHTIRNCARIWV